MTIYPPLPAGWLLLYHFALRHLPVVQEALGLKKRDKPTREELREDIDAMKVRVGHSSPCPKQAQADPPPAQPSKPAAAPRAEAAR